MSHCTHSQRVEISARDWRVLSSGAVVSMALESTAWLYARVTQFGIQRQRPELRRRGWTTADNFAFASAYQPGVGDPTRFTGDVVTPLTGDAASPLAAPLRRQHFECWTLNTTEIRRALERGEDDPPRRIPIVEKETRRRALEGPVGVYYS